MLSSRTYFAFELGHQIPICESVSPVSSKRWHGFTQDEFQAYRDRLIDEVFDYMKLAEEEQGRHFTMVISHHCFLNPLVMRDVDRKHGACFGEQRIHAHLEFEPSGHQRALVRETESPLRLRVAARPLLERSDPDRPYPDQVMMVQRANHLVVCMDGRFVLDIAELTSRTADVVCGLSSGLHCALAGRERVGIRTRIGIPPSPSCFPQTPIQSSGVRFSPRPPSALAPLGTACCCTDAWRSRHFCRSLALHLRRCRHSVSQRIQTSDVGTQDPALRSAERGLGTGV